MSGHGTILEVHILDNKYSKKSPDTEQEINNPAMSEPLLPDTVSPSRHRNYL